VKLLKTITIILMALNSLTANKLRASLALLGIVIGITAVITLMSLGRGVQQLIVSSLESMGTNLVMVMPDYLTVDLEDITSLTLSDSEALIDPDNAPSILAVAPEISRTLRVISPEHDSRPNVVGVTSSYALVRNLEVERGMFFSDIHVDQSSKVSVLGAKLADKLFDGLDPIGQEIRIGGGTRFNVIGLLSEKDNATFGVGINDMAFVPISAMYSNLNATRSISGEVNIDYISIKAVDSDSVEKAMAEATKITRLQHRVKGKDDFIVTSQQEILAMLEVAVAAIMFFLVSIAAISLLVGGIGIMNIMLVSVTERTREIGVRKALGAKRGDILLQFVVEAILLTGGGGLLGIIFGYACSRLLNGIPIGEESLQTSFSPDIALLALGVSAGIGLFFGIFPAYRASKLHPIEALRHQ